MLTMVLHPGIWNLWKYVWIFIRSASWTIYQQILEHLLFKVYSINGNTRASLIVPEMKVCKIFIWACICLHMRVGCHTPYFPQDFQPLQAIIFSNSLSSLQAFRYVGRQSRNPILKTIYVYITLSRGVHVIWCLAMYSAFVARYDIAAKAAIHGCNEVDVPFTVSEIGC